jgi:hypothetical protein
MSSPTINKLARKADEYRLPSTVILERMKALRAAGRYEWRGGRQRYVVHG